MPNPLVVITDSDLPQTNAEEQILGEAGFTARRAACHSAADVVDAARDADALIVQWAPITAEVLAELSRCRFVSRLGIGYDMVDVEAATGLGVAVANTPDYCVEEVATHAIALVLAGARRLLELDRAVRNGSWSVTRDAPDARRPSRTTLAVLGYGRIGSRTAAHAAALGFEVVVHDPGVAGERICAAGHRPASLDEALAAADVVSLHVPLSERTHHLLDRDALALMQPGGYVVNTCRGGLVDESALADALHAGRLGGAALDVFETEPLAPDSPLLAAPNLLVTPHAAWYSPDALAELPRQAARQVVDFFAERAVPSIVNPRFRDAPRTIDLEERA